MYILLRCIVFVETVVLFFVRSYRVVLPCRRYHRLHHSSALPMAADLHLQMHELRMCIHSTRPPASDPTCAFILAKGILQFPAAPINTTSDYWQFLSSASAGRAGRSTLSTVLKSYCRPPRISRLMYRLLVRLSVKNDSLACYFDEA